MSEVSTVMCRDELIIIVEIEFDRNLAVMKTTKRQWMDVKVVNHFFIMSELLIFEIQEFIYVNCSLVLTNTMILYIGVLQP